MSAPRLPRPAGGAMVPAESWDHTHPDHEWWTNGRGWCFDPACPDHIYGRPGPHPTCIDVTATDQTPRSEWACGPDRWRVEYRLKGIDEKEQA